MREKREQYCYKNEWVPVGFNIAKATYSQTTTSYNSLHIILDGSFKQQDLTHNSDQILTTRDGICWNAMILGYARNGDGVRAVVACYEMHSCGLKLDGVMFVLLLAACEYSGMPYLASKSIGSSNKV